MIEHVSGNLITMAKQGEITHLMHGCNCTGTMGSGLALAVRQAWPEAYTQYRDFHKMTLAGRQQRIAWELLGTIQFVPTDDITVVNAHTQPDYGRDRRYTDYEAIANCFEQLDDRLTGSDAVVGLPYALGCGLGGGNQAIVNAMRETLLNCRGYRVKVVHFQR